MKAFVVEWARRAGCPSWCKLARAAAFLATGGAVLAWSSVANAETTLGVELNYNDALDADASGAGVDVRFGPRLDLALLVLTTELGAGYHQFGGALEPALYRALAGGRLGVGFVIRPSVFAHVGVGHLRYDLPLDVERTGRTNWTGDVGAALDFTVLPLIDVGLQASYNVLAAGENTEAFEWVQAGVHLTFVF